MTKIINAYANGSGAIADSLKSLGDSMFGNEARQSLIRENAFKAQRQNAAAQGASDAYRSGNLIDYGANVVLGNPDSQAMGAGGLARRAATPNVGPDDTQLQTLQIGAGHPFSATAGGERENIAQKDRAQTYASDRAAQTQLSIDARTLTPMRDDNGQIQMVPKSEVPRYRQMGWMASETADTASNNRTSVATNAATNTQSGLNTAATLAQKTEEFGNTATHDLLTPDGRIVPVANKDLAAYIASGYRKMPTLENAKVNLLDPTLMGGTQGAPQTAGAPASPDLPRTSTLSPDQRSIAGLPTAVQSYVHPQTNEVVQSRDGGLTGVDAQGRQFKLQGSGFQPVPEGSALQAARDANVMKQANAPEPASAPNVSQGAAAEDAATTTGLVPFAQKHLNETFGALPYAPQILKGFSGSPQIGAATESARSDQELRNNIVRSTIMGLPGRPSKYAQEMVNRLLPQGPALDNPATEAQHVERIVQQLRADRAEAALIARDPNTLPADRQKYVQHMRQIDNAIRTMSAPRGQMAAPAAAPAQQTQAPLTAPPTQRTIGQTYQTPKGPMTWMADGWHPAQ